jgi:DNA-binding response OmpR family regulator
VNRKILVVDDSDNIRNVLKMNFEWIGYDVLAAGDGEEAIRMVQAEPPDLIILDVMMPRKNGFQVCRQFKSDPGTAAIPVILLTAKSQKEDVVWGKDCGADAFITKPFQTSDLEAAVRRLLARAGPRPAAGGGRSLKELVAQKARQGLACGMCEFTLEPTALQVYLQKYGELREAEIYRQVKGTIDQVMREAGLPPQTEAEGRTFRVFVPGATEEIQTLQLRIKETCNRSLVDLYDEDDRSRGHVMSRDFRTGRDRKVPLLALAAGPAELFNQGRLS